MAQSYDPLKHWVYFRIDSPNNPTTHAREMIVYRNPKAELYFFANTVAACLGFERPHEAIRLRVKDEDKHSVPIGSGIFLNEEGVERLTATVPAHKTLFNQWMFSYIQNCTQSRMPGSDCP